MTTDYSGIGSAEEAIGYLCLAIAKAEKKQAFH